VTRAGPGLPGALPPQQAALLRPRTWSGPGTPGRPGATSAARSAHDPATPAPCSGRADDYPAAAHTRAVQETWTA